MRILHKIFLLVNIFIFSVAASGHDVEKLPANTTLKDSISKQIIELGNECWRLRGVNPDSALQLGKKAMTLSHQYQITNEIPRLNNYLGVIYLNYGFNVKQSIIYFHRALDSSYKNNDSTQMAYAFNNLGDVCLASRNLPLAFEYAKNTLKIFKAIHHQAGISYGYVNLALAYRENKDYVSAIKYLFKAKKIWEELGNEIGTGAVLLEIARTYNRMDELNQALKYYQIAYTKFHNIERLRYVPECLNGMANIYSKQGKFVRALEFYQQALIRNKKQKNDFASIDNLIGRAIVFANLRSKSKGELALDSAVLLSENLGINSKIVDAYRAAPQFYEIMGDYKQSVKCYHRFVRKYDSLMMIQKAELISELEENFKTVQILGKNQHALRIQKVTKNYILLIGLLLLALFVVFFYRFWSYRKISRHLKQSNVTKDKLFSLIAHDLKAPFNSSLGFINLLIKELEKENYQKVKKFAKYVKQSSEESVNLLNHLMAWSRAQTGTISYNPEFFEMDVLLNEVKKLLIVKTEKDNIHLEFKTYLQKSVYADMDLLRTILLNLISNAIKFTNNGGLIQVIASNHESTIQIQVIDNGLGIEEERLKGIFTENSKLQSTLGVRNEQGTGLGLNICRELIQIHQGSIRVDSKLGKGSVFTIEFPNTNRSTSDNIII